jgi:phosphohistidine phosphatase
MDLYLIRHAEAKALGEDGITKDEERTLTGAGEAQARRLADVLRRRNIQFGVLATSPLTRAQQTAESIARHWPEPAPQIQVRDELAPGEKPKKLARYLRSLGNGSVALVGHMPDLAQFLGWLIGSRKAQIDLGKAGVAFVRCEDIRKGEGELEWLVTSDWFE